MEGRGRPGALGTARRRRAGGAIYLQVRRNFPNPDAPRLRLRRRPFTTIGRRSVSNVPSQALILLNNPLVHQLAGESGPTRVLRKDAGHRPPHRPRCTAWPSPARHCRTRNGNWPAIGFIADQRPSTNEGAAWGRARPRPVQRQGVPLRTMNAPSLSRSPSPNPPRLGNGFGAVALRGLLGEQDPALVPDVAEPRFGVLPRAPHFPAKARRRSSSSTWTAGRRR